MNIRKLTGPGLRWFLFILFVIPATVSLPQSSMFTRVFTNYGDGAEESNAIISDSDGNLYITGLFSAPCIFGDDTLTLAGYENVFVARCHPDTGFVWAFAPVCSTYDYAFGEALAFDTSGNVYVTGYFKGQFDFGDGWVLSSVYTNTFIASFAASGQVNWARSFTGDGSILPASIAGNSEGNIYITGHFEQDISYGDFSLFSYDMTCFLLKINQEGMAEWLIQSGGEGNAYLQSMCLDPSGNIFLTGSFVGEVCFGPDTLPGIHPGYSARDIFISKADPGGNFVWAVQAGGGRQDYGHSIVCSQDGSVYVNGIYGYQAFFGDFTIYTEDFYDSDMFLVEMDGGGEFLSAKSIDISCFDNNIMCIDSSDYLYITNVYSGNQEHGPSYLEGHGYNDIYVMKLDQDGEIIWAKGAGSSYEDRGLGIALHPGGGLAVTGYLSSGAEFDSIHPQNGTWGVFVALLDQYGKVAISEINYKSADTLNSGDWVEFRNTGSSALDMTGWTLKDGNDNNLFTISPETVLEPNDYLVLCQDIESFSAIHPNVSNCMGSFGFDLAPNGEKVRLFDQNGLLTSQVFYKSIAPWPALDNTSGRTLELLSWPGELSDGSNWFAGCPGGSPGRKYMDCDSVGIGIPELFASRVKIYPDPVVDRLNIAFTSQDGSGAEVNIYDLAGRPLIKQTFPCIQPGINTLFLEVDNLTSGIYLIVIRNSVENFSLKFIKAR